MKNISKLTFCFITLWIVIIFTVLKVLYIITNKTILELQQDNNKLRISLEGHKGRENMMVKILYAHKIINETEFWRQTSESMED